MSSVNDIEAKVGTITDPASTDTLFGVLNGIEAYAKLIGQISDSSSTKSLFGNIASLASKASSILQEVQYTRDEAGGKGKPENTRSAIDRLAKTTQEMKVIIDTMMLNKVDGDEMSKRIVDSVVSAANESAKSLGLKMGEIESLTKAQAGDSAKLRQKLTELKSILSALSEAQQENKAVVKSWLESE